MTIDEAIDKLSDRNLRLVSERIGVSYTMITKFAKGDNRNPTLRTFTKITNYLERG